MARSSIVVVGRSRLDRYVGFVCDEVMPVVAGLHGCTGLSLLVDRDRGRCITTTGWWSSATLDGSVEALHALQQREADFADSRVRADRWEVVSLHRRGHTMPGMRARVSWVSGTPAQLDKAIDLHRCSHLPAFEDLDGFGGASLLLDAHGGRLVSSVSWSGSAALIASAELAIEQRRGAVAALGLTVLEVAEMEVALAHLRLPELV